MLKGHGTVPVAVDCGGWWVMVVIFVCFEAGRTCVVRGCCRCGHVAGDDGFVSVTVAVIVPEWCREWRWEWYFLSVSFFFLRWWQDSAVGL